MIDLTSLSQLITTNSCKFNQPYVLPKAHWCTEIMNFSTTPSKLFLFNFIDYFLEINPYSWLVIFILLTVSFIYLISEKIKSTQLVNSYRLQLSKKNFELERKTKDLQNFLYRTTHDLRSPIITLKGILNLVKNEVTDNPRTCDYFNKIDSILNKEDEMLKRLMEVSCTINGLKNIENISFDKLINELIESYKEKFHSEKIELITDIEKNIEIKTDPTLLKKALEHLLINSIKFKRRRPEGSFIKLCSKKDNEVLSIEITDNGLGIPESCHDKLFELFSRASQEKSGAGLGLFIVRNTIESLGGTIKLKSQYKYGSSFNIQIPI